MLIWMQCLIEDDAYAGKYGKVFKTVAQKRNLPETSESTPNPSHSSPPSHLKGMGKG